jgi:uncharacterized membrane protein
MFQARIVERAKSACSTQIFTSTGYDPSEVFHWRASHFHFGTRIAFRAQICLPGPGTVQFMLQAPAAQGTNMPDDAPIKDIPLFGELDQQNLAGLRDVMQARHFMPGQVIIREGEAGDLFYIITEGTVQFSTVDAGGNELILDEAEKGSFFGEISMLTGSPRSVRVRAKDQVSTLALGRDHFHEYLLKHPPAAIDILTAMARRLHRTDSLLRQTVTPNVNEVMDERLTFGQRVADGFATVMGSWPFIIIQSLILTVWVVLNVLAWKFRWDPYPFILMNLAMSLQAAYAAPIIMMSQNRSSAKDRLAAEIDHDVNVKAELKISLIMNRLDDLERSLHFLHEEQRMLLEHAGIARSPRLPASTGASAGT